MALLVGEANPPVQFTPQHNAKTGAKAKLAG